MKNKIKAFNGLAAVVLRILGGGTELDGILSAFTLLLSSLSPH